MCTGMEKLRRAGDQLAIERNQERNELMKLRKELSQAIKEKETAEFQEQNIRHHNMRLTRTADFSNCCMCASLMIAFVAVGVVVYLWP